MNPSTAALATALGAGNLSLFTTGASLTQGVSTATAIAAEEQRMFLAQAQARAVAAAQTASVAAQVRQQQELQLHQQLQQQQEQQKQQILLSLWNQRNQQQQLSRCDLSVIGSRLASDGTASIIPAGTTNFAPHIPGGNRALCGPPYPGLLAASAAAAMHSTSILGNANVARIQQAQRVRLSLIVIDMLM